MPMPIVDYASNRTLAAHRLFARAASVCIAAPAALFIVAMFLNGCPSLVQFFWLTVLNCPLFVLRNGESRSKFYPKAIATNVQCPLRENSPCYHPLGYAFYREHRFFRFDQDATPKVPQLKCFGGGARCLWCVWRHKIFLPFLHHHNIAFSCFTLKQ